MKVGQFPVEKVLVEEKIAMAREFFLSFAVDDAACAPIILFSPGGGSGIERPRDLKSKFLSVVVATAHPYFGGHRMHQPAAISPFQYPARRR